MTTTPRPPPSGPFAWRASDLEAIRIALSIPVLAASLRAIHEAMAALEQTCPEQLQAPIARRRKAAVAGAVGADGALPVSKADVILYGTDLLREETTTRYQQPASTDQLLRRQRSGHAQALLLMLPTLAGWSRDPLLAGTSEPFSAPMARG